MALDDAKLAVLQGLIYDGPSACPWDHYEQADGDDGWCWATKSAEGHTVLVLRGSVTVEDWARDAASQAVRLHPRLGPVAFGFSEGLDDAYRAVLPHLGGRTVLVGHSLGAARALLLAGLLVMYHRPPVACVTWGSPRPAFGRLRSTLIGGRVITRGYRNGEDPVTEVPVGIGGVEPFQHPELDWRQVLAPPDPADQSPFRWHHIALYEAATAAQESVPTITQ